MHFLTVYCAVCYFTYSILAEVFPPTIEENAPNHAIELIIQLLPQEARHGTCEACVSKAYQLCQSCRAHRATSVLYDFSHLGWWLMCMHEAGGPGHIPSLLFMHETGHSKGHTASTGTTTFSQLLFPA